MNAAASVSPITPIIASAVWGVGLVLGLAPLLVSVMMFDAPGSEDNPWTWVLAGGFASFPVLCLVSLCATWLAWLFTRRWTPERAAAGRIIRLATALLPTLGVLAVLFGIVMLQWKCGGSFSCRP